MDNVDLSNSPDLTMEEITKQLFNNEYLSDIHFRIEEKVLYAHSWELMKRSIVFREQFRNNLGVMKEIPIVDTTYNVFYQFLAFIYIDECSVTEEMICDLLKLAVKYKIVKLENKLLRLGSTVETDLKLLDYSVDKDYELGHRYFFHQVIKSLYKIKEPGKFLNINSEAVEEILKYNYMPPKMTEIKLFNALVAWIESECNNHQRPLSERRSRFDKLLQLIRFSCMTSNEFRLCATNHLDLFTSEDISIIRNHITLGIQNRNDKWFSEPRLKYINPVRQDTFQATDHIWTSVFTVSTNIILYGLRLGSGYDNFEIHISVQNYTPSNCLIFKFDDSETDFNIISLGESIKLQPNLEYTIDIKLLNGMDYTDAYYRKKGVNLIVTGPSNLIKFSKKSRCLFEINFKLPIN